MRDYFLKRLQRGISRAASEGESRKNNIIISAIILMLAMGIFFYAFSGEYAFAQKSNAENSLQVIFKPEYIESILELKNINLIFKESQEEDNCETGGENDNQTDGSGDSAIFEEKYDKKNVPNFLCEFQSEGLAFENEESNEYCQDAKADEEENYKGKKILDMVVGHPIEEMIPFISKRDEKVAYYLVAIAKKESNWGKHSPKKNGGTCYNYWGYKGKYNKTKSGYSCFDSPEHAIQAVGDRIKDLINKEIDTPEEFIVWKCGATCAGHDPQGVLKWISDVKLYYNKLNT